MLCIKKIEKVGDTSFLDWAIRKVMNDPSKVEHEVSLHLLELGIKLYCRATGDLVLNFPYPKVYNLYNNALVCLSVCPCKLFAILKGYFTMFSFHVISRHIVSFFPRT